MITIKDNHFVDQYGRVLHLRGVNLGGSTKVPKSPDGATWNKNGFYDHRNVSFVGKPFPLEEADEHFTRLKSWGLTFLRFLITWEAVEHQGPGQYDQEYLDYLTQVVERAGEHGFTLFIDPHQDVWSRFTGGDGAPGWIFEKLGMDLTKFHAAGTTFIHQESGDPYPRMMWSSNYSRYVCATMWTLFFGGNTFAPDTKIDRTPIQDYLQGHYFNAIKQVAERLKGFPHIIGFDTLNEPSPGYIGYSDLNQIASKLVAQGSSPTMFQGMLLAAGYPQRVSFRGQVPIYFGRTQLLNPEGISIWKKDTTPIWRKYGVWDLYSDGHPRLLKPDYFSVQNNSPVDFNSDHFVPFVKSYTQAVREHKSDAAVFVSPPPGELTDGKDQHFYLPADDHVYKPHWYDVFTLFFQRYIPWFGIEMQGGKVKFLFGRARKRKGFAEKIAWHISMAEQLFGSAPTVIGETGISYNLDNKLAYENGDFSRQVEAMDDTIQALEANMVSFTLWNYTADNTNLRGDLWNDEDLSIFSRDQQNGSGDINDGGRALQAVIRPYAAKIPGKPLRMAFDIHTKRFEFEFEFDPEIDAPLEIYLPDFHYPRRVTVTSTAGQVELLTDQQKIHYSPEKSVNLHIITITPK
jgi:hypothetical protein